MAADETWARSFEPELKRQSAQWRSPTSPQPQKAIWGYAKQKVMHIVFYTSKKVLCNYAVPPKTTVTAELYRWVLIHKLRPAIAKKQPELLRKSPILLHDEARPHIADVVKEQLMDWGWEVLDHPPYSPDISPCDFHLFPLMKELLRGIRPVWVCGRHQWRCFSWSTGASEERTEWRYSKPSTEMAISCWP